VRGRVIYDGAHSMGNKGWLVPLRYLCRSGKFDKTGDPRKWQGEPSMGKIYCPRGMRT
jgi:hypothetical protein